MMLSSQVPFSPSCWRIDLTCSRASRSLGGDNTVTHITGKYTHHIYCHTQRRNRSSKGDTQSHVQTHTVSPTSLFVTGIWFRIFQVFLTFQWRGLWTANLLWSNPTTPDGQFLLSTSHWSAFQTCTKTQTVCEQLICSLNTREHNYMVNTHIMKACAGMTVSKYMCVFLTFVFRGWSSFGSPPCHTVWWCHPESRHHPDLPTLCLYTSLIAQHQPPFSLFQSYHPATSRKNVRIWVTVKIQLTRWQK